MSLTLSSEAGSKRRYRNDVCLWQDQFQDMCNAGVEVATNGKVAESGGETHVETECFLDIESPCLENSLVSDLQRSRRLCLEVLERLSSPGRDGGSDGGDAEGSELGGSL